VDGTWNDLKREEQRATFSAILSRQFISYVSNLHLRDCVCCCKIALSEMGSIRSSGRLAVKNDSQIILKMEYHTAYESELASSP